MKWKWIVAVTVAGWFVLRLANLMQAEPMTYYNYLTDIENTRYNEIIWFWTPDTIFGPVRTNDFLAVKRGSVFAGHVYTAQSEITVWGNADLDSIFLGGITLNCAPYNFPKTLSDLRRMARRRYSDGNGMLMTWIRLRGEDGVDVFQYPIGSPRRDSLVDHFPVEGRTVIWVDGQAEIEGILSGQLTIGSSQDMWLLNDIRYAGANERTGEFDEASMQSIIGVASESNIIIADTPENGHANGYNEDRNNWNRHSIVLDGSYVALGESFTFEHQNDDADAYRGPTPDERGQIYLKGSVTQLRHGYTHRSNHQSTGYGISYRYDFRLLMTGAPGFAPGEYTDIRGEYGRLVLNNETYSIRNAHARIVIVRAGVELRLGGSDALVVTDSLIVEGTPQDSVHFTPLDGGGRVTVEGAYCSLRCLKVAPNVAFSFNGDTLNASGVAFGDEFDAEGSLAIDSCSFARSATLTGWQRVSVTRSLYTGGLILSGSPRECAVTNCTIEGANGIGLRVRSSVTPTLVNDIFVFNRVGILNDRPDVLEFRYCDVFGNSQDDFVGCRAGAGSNSEDPLFVNRRSGDFHLTANSPCIDAGDPDSPGDPDGTRSDIGAFYFAHQLSAKSDFLFPFSSFLFIDVAPNPFNERTKVTVAIPAAGKMRLAVYDVNGRLRGTLFDGQMEKGSRSFALDASGWPAGVYLVRMVAGREVKVEKVVKVN